MNTYDVTYVNNKGHQYHISVIATDVRHAINQVLELKPECRVTLPFLNLCGMKLNEQALDDFISYLVESMNQDVYYQLKDWVSDQIDEDQDFGEVIDFFVNNLDGSLEWIKQ